MDTDLTNVNLPAAILFGSGLSGSTVERKTLDQAFLCHTIMPDGVESKSDLSNSDLTGSFLYKVDLRGADLEDADLTDAYLSGADLTDAHLRAAKLVG